MQSRSRHGRRHTRSASGAGITVRTSAPMRRTRQSADAASRISTAPAKRVGTHDVDGLQRKSLQACLRRRMGQPARHRLLRAPAMTMRSTLGLGAPPAPHWLRWLALSVAIVIADQITKLMVLSRFRVGERLPVIDGLFDLVLAFNPGAAFSFLSSASGWQRYLFVALALVVSALIVLFLRRPGGATLHLGLALILGGALGNVIDRLYIGEVVDFLLVYHGGWSWPAFNVADSAISIGAGLLILDSFRARHADEPRP